MRRIPEVRALQGLGLETDRYAVGRGYYSRWPGRRDVTLISAEVLDQMTESFGVRVLEGQHRRNLVVRGVPLEAFQDRSFRIGAALFAYQGPRPPCGYLERITEAGMTKALGLGAGLVATVLESGVIREGDTIELLPLDPTVKRRWLP